MRKKLLRGIVVGITGLSLSMTTGVVFAQGVLEEIIVTAQKREQAVNDIGMSISAFTGDDLIALGFTDTRDLAALVPGLTMAKSSSNTPI